VQRRRVERQTTRRCELLRWRHGTLNWFRCV
jgi:hypothetical protein